MHKVSVQFSHIIVKSQQAGSTDDHMVSRMAFPVAVEGRPVENAYVDLKQVVGAPMAPDAIEVSAPVGYTGPPIPQQELAKAASAYFLDMVGPNGRIYQFASTGQVNMEDCIAVGPPRVVTFESAR